MQTILKIEHLPKPWIMRLLSRFIMVLNQILVVFQSLDVKYGCILQRVLNLMDERLREDGLATIQIAAAIEFIHRINELYRFNNQLNLTRMISMCIYLIQPHLRGRGRKSSRFWRRFQRMILKKLILLAKILSS